MFSREHCAKSSFTPTSTLSISRRSGPTLVLATLALVGAGAQGASAQAQLRGPKEQVTTLDGQTDSKASLRATSMFIVEAPKPKTYAIHDVITIIINETSKQSSDQKLETESSGSVKGELSELPNITKLLQGELTNTSSSPIASVDISGGDKFEGDAKYERSDRFSDRISAIVIDVKPNGTLVLEARRAISKDDEVQTVILSGICRREDVTSANSILSSQLADLAISVQNEGELRNANKPGWITRAFRTIFDF